MLQNKKIYYVVPEDGEITKKIVLCTDVNNQMPFILKGSKEIRINVFIDEKQYTNEFYY